MTKFNAIEKNRTKDADFTTSNSNNHYLDVESLRVNYIAN